MVKPAATKTTVSTTAVAGKPSIRPAAVFSADVEVHNPGSAPEKISFLFHHRTQDELKAFDADMVAGKLSDAKIIETLVAGWGFVEDFDEAGIAEIIQHRAGIAARALAVYARERSGAAVGN